LYQLQPEVLTEKGLAEALQIRFDSVERALGIRVDYQVDGQHALPNQIAEALYWAALEGLNNILKHAAVKQIAVRLQMMAQTARLEISDNGQGFDPAQVKGGMGLKNIRQRIEQVGGIMEISSAPGAGSRLVLAVDLAGMLETTK
jgi:signal transduction histidine kinase